MSVFAALVVIACFCWAIFSCCGKSSGGRSAGGAKYDTVELSNTNIGTMSNGYTDDDDDDDDDDIMLAFDLNDRVATSSNEDDTSIRRRGSPA